MKDRIRQLRKDLGLNQTDFGDRIGVKQGSIAAYENGLRTPIDAVITSICREFGVNEEWLRYGTGDMYIKLSKDQELAAFVAEVYKEDDNSFKRRLLSVLSSLSEDEWKLLADIAEKIAKEKD
nr:helix-turn-helix transcriptional regulator [uncultured Sellimonas sp.]